MLALLDSLLIMLMRLCRLDRVVIRNLDDLVNPYSDGPGQPTSLMAYRRRLMRDSKAGCPAEGLKVGTVRTGGQPLSSKRSQST